jgi:lysophospholipase L1-like esterase
LPLTAEFLARDGFHPNEAASRNWCEQVLAAVSV